MCVSRDKHTYIYVYIYIYSVKRFVSSAWGVPHELLKSADIRLDSTTCASIWWGKKNYKKREKK